MAVFFCDIVEYILNFFDLKMIVYTTLIICVSVVATSCFSELFMIENSKDLKNVYGKRPTISNKIYVAGSWVQREFILTNIKHLRELGYIVTSNWPLFSKRLDNPDDLSE